MSFLFENFATSQLNEALTSIGTEMNIPPADEGLFPSASSTDDPAPCILFDRDRVQPPEVIYMTNNAADGSFTIIRAQEGSVAQAWPVGTVLFNTLTAAAYAGLQTDTSAFALKDMSNVEAKSITGSLIDDFTIDTPNINGDAISNAKLQTNSIHASEILADSITTVKILNGNVTNAKLDTDAVQTANILNEAITKDKIVESQQLPPGAIVMHGGGSLPTGWLNCDGDPVSRTTFADLFAIIGTTFGVGDGSTTFNVPSFIQKVPKGYLGAGTYALGNAHAAANLAHVHPMSFVEGGGGVDDAEFNSTGAAAASQNTGSEGEADSVLTGAAALFINFIIKT